MAPAATTVVPGSPRESFRVGLVWDGADTTLYVDDVEVARGTLTGLPFSMNDLYLGVGSTLSPGTFWSGLIDDVRIYNRAVRP